MYTECEIQFVDDGTVYESVIIKAADEYTSQQEDDMVFFYGYTPERLRKAMENDEILEGEWRVIDIYGVYDSILS